ncbi:MAG: chemotaxis protein CheW [Gemmatimonadaceae bacterium]
MTNPTEEFSVSGLATADASAVTNVVDVRRRVHAVARAARAEGTMTPEKAKEVLAARARELAAIPPALERGDSIEVIEFLLAGERYALETGALIEVFRLADLTTLPGAESPVLGLTAWRGRLLRVLDLRAALNVPTTALNDLAYVLVLGTDRAAFGVLADTMLDVRVMDRTAVQEPAEGLAASRAALRGVTADALMVIDASHLVRAYGETSQGERHA